LQGGGNEVCHGDKKAHLALPQDGQSAQAKENLSTTPPPLPFTKPHHPTFTAKISMQLA
jgi:hypothetical protein